MTKWRVYTQDHMYEVETEAKSMINAVMAAGRKAARAKPHTDKGTVRRIEFQAVGREWAPAKPGDWVCWGAWDRTEESLGVVA